MTSNNVDLPSALVSRYSRIGTAGSRGLFSGSAVTHADYAAVLTGHGQRDESASLYVHLPFCATRCLSCENNAVITHNRKDIDRYLDGLEREIGLLGRHFGHTVKLQQLHLGGGSPNYLSDRQLIRLMAMIDEVFERDETTDCSLDANPQRTSPSQLALLSALGFESIFFGLRDLEPDVQLAIGRRASFRMIEDLFAMTRDSGFATIGTDILYGLPCQTIGGMQHTVERLLALAPDRISCKAFTRQAAERAHQSAIDSCRVPSLADKLAQFNALIRGLAGEYNWVGLDCFARHDDALAQAQANDRLHKNWIGYSHLPASNLYGIGTNAVSDLDAVCVQNFTALPPWHGALARDQLPIGGGVRLNETDRRRREAVKTLICGQQLSDHSALFDSLDDRDSAWAGFARDGLLSVSAKQVRLTDEGRCLLPHLLAGTAAAAASPA